MFWYLHAIATDQSVFMIADLVYKALLMNTQISKENISLPATLTADNINTLIQNAGAASELFKALSHESRLIILCALLEKERSVMELEQILSQRQSTVSQQLARLRSDKLVKARREGQTMYYSIMSETTKQIITLLTQIYTHKALY